MLCTVYRCFLSVCVLCGSPVWPSPPMVGPLWSPPLCVGPPVWAPLGLTLTLTQPALHPHRIFYTLSPKGRKTTSPQICNTQLLFTWNVSLSTRASHALFPVNSPMEWPICLYSVVCACASVRLCFYLSVISGSPHTCMHIYIYTYIYIYIYTHIHTHTYIYIYE